MLSTPAPSVRGGGMECMTHPNANALTNMPAKIAPETLALIKGWPLFYRIDLIRRNRDRWPFFQSMTDADVMAWLHKHDL